MSSELTFKAGDYVIREGEEGRGFYILKAGQLRVMKGISEVARISDPDTIFGEMSDILGKVRTCSVVADEDTEIVHVEESINDIVQSQPELAQRLLSLLAQRLEETTDKLSESDAHLLWTVGHVHHRSG